MKKLLLILALLVSGCSMLVTSPEVKVTDVNVIGIDTDGLDLEFFINVNNPNSFDVTLKGYSYDVQVMTLPVAKGGCRDRLEFKAKGATDMRLPVRLHYRDLVEVLKRRPDPDRIPYRLVAGLELDTAVGEMLVPVDKSATFAVPQQYRPSWVFKRIGDFIDRVRK